MPLSWCKRVRLGDLGVRLQHVQNGNLYNMSFLIPIPIAGMGIFASIMIRSSLTLSEAGLCFTGAFSSKRQVSWQEVKGFYENLGEIDLKVETPNGKPQFGIPISWFAKMRLDQKPYSGDLVMNSLLVFAPHLFNIRSSE